MKAIICMFIPQPPLCPTYAYGEFYWSKEHKCYVWGGQTKKPRILEMVEFNRIVDRLLDEQDFFGKRTVRMLPDPIVPPPAEPLALMTRAVPDDLAQHHDALVEEVTMAQLISEGAEVWKSVPLNTPLLSSVANLRLLYEQAVSSPAIPQMSFPARKRGIRRRSKRAKVNLIP